MNTSSNLVRSFSAFALKPALATLAVAWLVGAAPVVSAVPNSNPGVLPPGSRLHGLSYGEWAARWWATMFSVPIVDGSHPFFTGGFVGSSEGVVFLAAVGGGAQVPVTIPRGAPIFLPVINAECSVYEPDPFHGDDEAELRACANGHMDTASGLSAVIDGTPVQNLGAYRVQSPLFELGPLPADNILGAPTGTTSLAVDAGVYLLVAPLSTGTHTLQVKGTIEDLNFSIDTTLLITVK